jgi:hypothetical protein
LVWVAPVPIIISPSMITSELLIPDVPILILLYIGNDLVDESILQSIAPRYERYFDVRYEIFSTGRRQPYFPCFEPTEVAGRPIQTRIVRALQRHFIAFKLATVAAFRIKELASSFSVDGGQETIEDMAAYQCYRPPHSVMVNGRVFFFELHNFSVDPNSISNKESELKIRRYLVERAHDKNLMLAVALSREEVCKEFHKVPVKEAKGLINQFAGIGLQMVDPNPIFSEECLRIVPAGRALESSWTQVVCRDHKSDADEQLIARCTPSWMQEPTCWHYRRIGRCARGGHARGRNGRLRQKLAAGMT